MSAHQHHHAHAEAGDRRVLWAVAVNVALTLAQVIGGLVAGSLALIADAVHNFSDAVALAIAFGARKISRRPSDEGMTFGYVRAEIVAALINYTSLIVIGLYLAYEAVYRFFQPQEIYGWVVVAVAGVALAIDLITAALTYALAKTSVNIRAAFLHNVADALGSVGVIVAGALIILYDWRVVDPIVTLLIAVYILWQAFNEIGVTIRILMLGTPPDLDMNALLTALRSIEGVADVHHLHVWAIDEHNRSLEAHIVPRDAAERDDAALKRRIRALMRERFEIAHSTLEIEDAAACPDGEAAPGIGHPIAPAAAGRAHRLHS